MVKDLADEKFMRLAIAKARAYWRKEAEIGNIEKVVCYKNTVTLIQYARSIDL